MKVGFIGVGKMGAPMARRLLDAGHAVTIYNRTRSHAEAFSAAGVPLADSPAAAARGADAVVTMVADDLALEAVTLGEDGVLGALAADAVHVPMSTVSVRLAERLAGAHAASERWYVAAPVFGRPDVAQSGRLAIVAAGAEVALDRCQPLFEAMGRATFVVGEDPAAANVVKLAGNFMIASMIETAGEAYAFVRRSGLSARAFCDVLDGTLFAAPIYKNYARAIVEERFEPAGFRMALGLKDVGLVLEQGTATATPMPLASVLRDHFLSGVAKGWKDLDWAGMAKVIATEAGL